MLRHEFTPLEIDEASLAFGGQDAAERASRIWRKTLEAYEPPPLDEAVRQQLQEFVDRRRKELGD
jgi:trimethylamine--corrinoid protein Co-methyltransferase